MACAAPVWIRELHGARLSVELATRDRAAAIIAVVFAHLAQGQRSATQIADDVYTVIRAATSGVRSFELHEVAQRYGVKLGPDKRRPGLSMTVWGSKLWLIN